MQDILVVVDMQNDFIDGSLGTKEALSIVPNVVDKVKSFNGTVLFTRDTHYSNYPDTQEGKDIPTVHCQKGSYGWNIRKELDELRKTEPIDKETFGSEELGKKLASMNLQNKIESVTLVGLCTDICVNANAYIVKESLPNAKIIVDASCCAGSSIANHAKALDSMANNQILIINR